jgi:hypothetical protein
LAGKPLEEISDDMRDTVGLLDKMCSVSSGNVQNYSNQILKHMFNPGSEGSPIIFILIYGKYKFTD